MQRALSKALILGLALSFSLTTPTAKAAVHPAEALPEDLRIPISTLSELKEEEAYYSRRLAEISESGECLPV